MTNQTTIEAAKDLMRLQTKRNGAPAWPLTEIAVKKGRALAHKFGAREDLVAISLYLAHTVFSKNIRGDVQQKYMFLSADFAKIFLEGQGLAPAEIKIVINAIELHHGHKETESLEAEIVKNAEGFKFLSLAGAEVFLKDLQKRGMTIEEAKKELIRKMEQKFGYLTLPECIEEAKRNVLVLKEIYK